jgi:hypothetical protein
MHGETHHHHPPNSVEWSGDSGIAQGTVGWFTAPEQTNHRRYEALRAFFVDGATHAEAAERFGYTRWTMVDLVRKFRRGELDLFAAPGRPGPARRRERRRRRIGPGPG